MAIACWLRGKPVGLALGDLRRARDLVGAGALCS
jgi:hypothetical protein